MRTILWKTGRAQVRPDVASPRPWTWPGCGPAVVWPRPRGAAPWSGYTEHIKIPGKQFHGILCLFICVMKYRFSLPHPLPWLGPAYECVGICLSTDPGKCCAPHRVKSLNIFLSCTIYSQRPLHDLLLLLLLLHSLLCFLCCLLALSPRTPLCLQLLTGSLALIWCCCCWLVFLP